MRIYNFRASRLFFFSPLDILYILPRADDEQIRNSEEKDNLETPCSD